MRFKAFYNAQSRGFIWALQLRSNGCDITVTIRINAINQSSTADETPDQTVTPKITINWDVLRHFDVFLNDFAKLIYLHPSILESLDSSTSMDLSSRLVSTPTEWWKVRFHRSIKENLSLEHRWSFSKSWNEKPWIQKLIGSFRSLSRVRIHFFPQIYRVRIRVS